MRRRQGGCRATGTAPQRNGSSCVPEGSLLPPPPALPIPQLERENEGLRAPSSHNFPPSLLFPLSLLFLAADPAAGP